MECFVKVCMRGLKVNAVKSKVMVLNGKVGLECGSCEWDTIEAYVRN